MPMSLHSIDIGQNLTAECDFTQGHHRLKNYLGKISLRAFVRYFRTELVETGLFLSTQ